jgi:hypothetical protein
MSNNAAQPIVVQHQERPDSNIDARIENLPPDLFAAIAKLIQDFKPLPPGCKPYKATIRIMQDGFQYDFDELFVASAEEDYNDIADTIGLFWLHTPDGLEPDEDDYEDAAEQNENDERSVEVFREEISPVDYYLKRGHLRGGNPSDTELQVYLKRKEQ